MSLQSRIEELERLLYDREKDLALAAEIGQSLLVQNQQLEQKLKEGCPSCSTHINRLETLEQTHQDLLENYEIVAVKEKELMELSRQQKESIKRLEVGNQQLVSQASEQSDLIKTLAEDKQKLAREKAELVKDLQMIQSTCDGQSKQIMDLKKHVKDLEVCLNQSGSSTVEMQESLRALEQVNEELQFKVQELEQLLETYQSYRETCDEQTLTIEQLNLELEFVRESNQKLTARLSVLDSNLSNAEPDMGSKTLLSEIEDRRQELILAHQALAEKHAGLAQTHEQSLYRQQKMKHHIARLSQLSTGFDEEKLVMLEQALAQCESEKRELEARLDKLQRQGHFMISRDFDDEGEIEDSERVQLLEYRIQQMMEECDSLKQTNQTLRLVKAAETEKVHQFTILLHEKERELENLKRLYSNLKFEHDELKLSLDHNSHSVGDAVGDTSLVSVRDILPESVIPTKPLESITSQDSILEEESGENKENEDVNGQKAKENIALKLSERPEAPDSLKATSKEFATKKTIKVDRSKVQQDCKQQ